MIHGKRYTYIKYKCRCAECCLIEKKYQADYHLKNKDKRNEKTKIWRSQNPDYEKTRENYKELHCMRSSKRRAMIRDNGAYSITRKETLKLYNTACTYCGNLDNITIDHIVALSRGGSHSIGNITSACKSCNFSKGSKTIMEWKKK